MPLLAKYVKETYRALFKLWVFNPELGAAFLNESAHGTRLADAAQVTLHIGHETGHSGLTESLGQNLQRNGLACTGSSSYQSVAVGHLAANRDGTILPMCYI